MHCRAFISYRRNDHPALAEWLFERLSREMNSDEVFLDRSSIETGTQFPDSIKQALNDAQATVVLIGSKWNNSVGVSTNQLDDPSDFVRLEVELALGYASTDRRRLIVPVLFDGTDDLNPATLPQSIREICSYQAYVLAKDHPYAPGLTEVVRKVVAHLDDQDGTPEEERWILKQIADALATDSRRVRQIGQALHARFPNVAEPDSTRSLARALYDIGPEALDCLVSLGDHDSKIAFLLELLATNWIRPQTARQLRSALVASAEGQNVAIDCEYADFTPKETLLKASKVVSGWPTISVKTSDSAEEILRQVHEALLLEFEPLINVKRTTGSPTRESESEERLKLCSLLVQHRTTHGSDLPVVLRVDHRLALDQSLLRVIHEAYPPLNVLVATNDPGELLGSAALDAVLHPADRDEDEQQAFTAYANAKRLLNRRIARKT